MHSFGKGKSNALGCATVSHPNTESVAVPVVNSDLVVAKKQKTVNIFNSSSIFYGVNVTGPVTINVLVNQR